MPPRNKERADQVDVRQRDYAYWLAFTGYLSNAVVSGKSLVEFHTFVVLKIIYRPPRSLWCQNKRRHTHTETDS